MSLDVAPPSRNPPGDAAMTWIIAERAAVETFRDRLGVLAGLILAIPVPLALLLVFASPDAGSAQSSSSIQATAVANLLVVGVLPAFSAVGNAAGQFAGEKERGVLTPLLASPASNLAIFGGKVLGAILPPLCYAALAEAVYLIGLGVLFGPDALAALSLALLVGTAMLVAGVTGFAAVAASLVSSRVRTFNAAQQLGGLVLMPVWGLVFALAAALRDLGPLILVTVGACLLVADVALAGLAAATWRREEVLARR